MIHYVYGEINRTNQSLLSVQDSDLKEKLDRDLPKIIGDLSQKDQILQDLIQKWYTKIDVNEIGFFSFPINLKSKSNHLEYLIGRTYITRASGGRISYSTHVILLTVEELKLIEYNLFMIEALDNTKPFEDITSLENLFNDSKNWIKTKSKEIDEKWKIFCEQNQLSSLDKLEIQELSLMTSYIPLKLEYQKYFHVFQSHSFLDKRDNYLSLKPEVFSLFNTQVHSDHVEEMKSEDEIKSIESDRQKQHKLIPKILIISLILFLLVIINVFVAFKNDVIQTPIQKPPLAITNPPLKSMVQETKTQNTNVENNLEVDISIEDIRNYAKKSPNEIKEILDSHSQKNFSSENGMKIFESIFYEYRYHYLSILNHQIKEIGIKSDYRELLEKLKKYNSGYKKHIDDFKETFQKHLDVIEKIEIAYPNDFKLKAKFQNFSNFASFFKSINWNYFNNGYINSLLKSFFISLFINLIFLTLIIRRFIRFFLRTNTKQKNSKWFEYMFWTLFLLSSISTYFIYNESKKFIRINAKIKESQVFNDDCRSTFEYIKNEKINQDACIITILNNKEEKYKINLTNPQDLDQFVHKINFNIEINQTK